MTFTGFMEKVYDGMVLVERTLFNYTFRVVSRIIERLTGFNNFDQVYILVGTFYAIFVFGMKTAVVESMGKFQPGTKVTLVIDPSSAWIPFASLFLIFTCGFVLRMCSFRIHTFYDGHLKETAANASDNDCFALAMLALLACLVFYHYHITTVRVITATVPLLYVMLRLAKAEPSFSWQEQDRRVKVLFGVLAVLLATAFILTVLIFSCREGTLNCKMYLWADVTIIFLLTFKIEALHCYIRQTKYGDPNDRDL